MKHSFLKFTGKKFLTALFISTSLLLTGFKAHAVNNTANIEILSSGKSDVQFTGSTPDALMFKVNIANEKSDNFLVTIKAEDGTVLFSKSFNDINFEKQFKILKGDTNADRYYFTITSSNKNLEETYVISSSSHIVDDVTVNKL